MRNETPKVTRSSKRGTISHNLDPVMGVSRYSDGPIMDRKEYGE
jgi:hypothetical protein